MRSQLYQYVPPDSGKIRLSIALNMLCIAWELVFGT